MSAASCMQQRVCSVFSSSVMSQFDDGALAVLPLKRTRAQACRTRRKHRIFQAGISRGIAVQQGPPGLQLHPAVNFIGPGYDATDTPADMLDDRPATRLHSPVESIATITDDDQQDLDDIFRFTMAIQQQRWQKADSAASCNKMADDVLKCDDQQEQNRSRNLMEDSQRLSRLSLLTYRDAIQISAVSICHLNLINTQLSEDTLNTPGDLSSRIHNCDNFRSCVLTSVERHDVNQCIERLRMLEGLSDEEAMKLHRFWQTHPCRIPNSR